MIDDAKIHIRCKFIENPSKLNFFRQIIHHQIQGMLTPNIANEISNDSYSSLAELLVLA